MLYPLSYAGLNSEKHVPSAMKPKDEMKRGQIAQKSVERDGILFKGFECFPIGLNSEKAGPNGARPLGRSAMRTKMIIIRSPLQCERI